MSASVKKARIRAHNIFLFVFKLYLRTLSAVSNRFHARLLLCGSVIYVALSLLEPIFFREIIDVLVGYEAGKPHSFAPLARVLGIWAGVGVLLLLVSSAVSLGADRMAHRSFHLLRRRYFDHAMQLSLRFHADTQGGKSLKKFTRGSDAIFWVQLEFYRRIFSNILIVLFLLPLCLWLNWYLGLTMIVFVILFLAVALPVMIRTNRKQSQIEDYYTQESGQVGDALGNVAIVKSFTRISHELERFRSSQKNILSLQLPLLNWWAFLVVLARIAHTLIFLSIFCVGSLLYFRDLASVGDIVMFIGFAALLLHALEMLLWQTIDVFWRYHGLKEFFEVLDEKHDITDSKDAKVMPHVQGQVEFENVTFSHDGMRNALEDISFRVMPGQVVALVGHTGAGKSTIANLLSRFFEVTTGTILIDDIDIRDVTQDSLRQNIGMVFQENLLFHDTVLANILIGDPNASEEKVIEAAKKARAWEFISELPDGLQTIVGERGVKLSGGERQRIAIARVILKDPPILVLDEATSALDAVTEKKLQEALDLLMQGRTTFIIAHRLSTIRKADRILVLEQGKIIEQGDFATLVKQRGEFAAMVEAQTSGFLI